MRADIRALIALDALCRIPCRNFDSYASLLILGCALRHSAVCISVVEGGYRDRIALHGVDRLQDIADESRLCCIFRCCFCGCSGPAVRNVDLDQLFGTGVYCRVIHIDNGLSLLAVGLQDRAFHVFRRIFSRNDICDLEEGGLKNGIGPVAEAKLCSDLYRVDRVEIDLLITDRLFHLSRKMCLKLFGGPLC